MLVLNVILKILAVIGIILLCLLGILLLALLLGLFIPIRYYVGFSKTEEELFIRLRIHWLLHIFRIHAEYNQQLTYKVWLLFFKLLDSTQPPKKKKEKSRSKSKSINEFKPEEATAMEEEKDNTKEAVEETAEKQENASVVQEEVGTEKPAGSLWSRILEKMKNILYTIRSFCDKIKAIFQNITYYIELLQEEDTALLFAKCKPRLFKVLKSIRPRKIKAELKIGTGQPDTTGYLLAVTGMLYPFFGNTIAIEPDFEQAVLLGQASFKGRITMFVFIIAAFKLYTDKELRTFIRKLKREEI